MLKFQQKEIFLKNFSNSLSICPLFSKIDAADLEKMLTCLGARKLGYDKKEEILAEGTQPRDVAILLSGRAQTVRIDYMGNRSILSESEPGELICVEYACTETDALPVSVVAVEPCVVMFIDCSHILHTCHNGCGFHHRLIFNLMMGLAEGNITMHKKVEVTARRTTRERLLTYLSIMAKEQGANVFDIPFNRQELADYLEVDRSGLSVEIGKLVKEGVIFCRKERFEILKPYVL